MCRMVGIHAMITNYGMNSYERNAIHAHLYAYIAGNITREVKNGNMDRYPQVWHDDAGCGRLRAEYIDRRQAAGHLR